MSSYHRSDKEEWDEMMEERRETRRRHYDEVIFIDRYETLPPDSWFWDDDREGVARRDQDRRDLMMKSEADMVMSRRRKLSNGWDW